MSVPFEIRKQLKKKFFEHQICFPQNLVSFQFDRRLSHLLDLEAITLRNKYGVATIFDFQGITNFKMKKTVWIHCLASE